MYDVAIIGGGPGGTTLGSMLRVYNPQLKILILEREKMPREHVGESLLPAVPQVLHEIGAWDKIERADFPLKLGATFRWGDDEPWDFQFIPGGRLRDMSRPGKFQAQRMHTAWQVDRYLFDKILFDHAGELGCELREETTVRTVLHTGDRVDGLVLDSGETIEARHYVDASGVSGILRRAMGVECEYPTALHNIAIWKYWDDADWAVELGANATRILILSIGYGWLWFIPIGGDRTSIGLVVPLKYYKDSGLKPAEIYDQAVRGEPAIAALMSRAESEGEVYTTNDWSYISDRLVGENWWLVGDSCGFADPILSAGMSLAMMGARHVAASILELDRGKLDPEWLKRYYNENQRARIRQHIMFADFWYSANGHFRDLVDYTKEIAAKHGFDITADAAFRWMASGGFAHEDPSLPMFGSYGLGAVRSVTERFSKTKSTWKVAEFNVFELDLENAVRDTFPLIFDGKIYAHPCWRRGAKVLPIYGLFEAILEVLGDNTGIGPICDGLYAYFQKKPVYPNPAFGVEMGMITLEAMIADGWVKCAVDPNEDFISYALPEESPVIHTNQDMILNFGSPERG